MDGLVLKEIALSKERTTLGRKPDNDIHIDNLAVSGHHAVIVTILNDSFLEDLHSTNGTLVNGRPVDKHFLQNGDVIEIGKYKLRYVTELTIQQGADYEKTMVLRQPARPQAAVATAPHVPPAALPVPAPAAIAAAAPAAASAQSPLGAIQILNGPATGRELELTKTLTTLGKPAVQVAVITRRPHGYFITHVEGANFPILNGRTLDAQPHPLSDHDVLELAGVKMEFFIKG
ncbi:MAG TPA: FHA domain-containing protein [Burkholderiales bacterium]|nr:FHA domain-containing protein [Burkholderiales bacterium]